MSGGDLFLVDDNPDNLTLLSGLLRDAGYQVRLVNSGRRALAAIRARPPELVLLDVSMPDLDGFAVCRALAEDPGTRDLPVIFLSARDDVADKVEAFRAGGVDYVTKPFQGEEVLARVDTQLRLARLKRALAEQNAALEAKNRALERAHQHHAELFGALAGALEGSLLDERYRLRAPIGAGGSAVVYRAERLADGAAVAVKVLRPRLGEDPAAQRRQVLEELEAARAVQHPHAIQVFDFGVTDRGIAYLVMELLEGRSLAALLEVEPRLELGRVARALSPVAAALAAAHAVGVIHRDVKPSNVFLARGPEGERPLLLDFGLARPSAPEAAGRLLGTPHYMAPEVLLGQPQDHRVDVYGLAMIAYRALAGALPFAGEALGAFLVAAVSSPLQPLLQLRPDLPPALADALMRGLAKRPVERPEAAELAALLAGAGMARPAPDGGETLEQTRRG